MWKDLRCSHVEGLEMVSHGRTLGVLTWKEGFEVVSHGRA